MRNAQESEKKAVEAKRLHRIQTMVMIGSITGCILLAGVYNLCFGAEISYKGHLGWTGDAHDAALGIAVIVGPCIGEAICWMIRRKKRMK